MNLKWLDFLVFTSLEISLKTAWWIDRQMNKWHISISWAPSEPKNYFYVNKTCIELNKNSFFCPTSQQHQNNKCLQWPGRALINCFFSFPNVLNIFLLCLITLKSKGHVRLKSSQGEALLWLLSFVWVGWQKYDFGKPFSRLVKKIFVFQQSMNGKTFYLFG